MFKLLFTIFLNEFCLKLGRALHRPSWIPAPESLLKLALGELGSLMTTGQRVVPKKAIEKGYVFQYATLDSALQALFSETTVVGRVA